MTEYIEDATETEPPMFPKGIHQLLGWSYAMQGIDPHEPSVHAKMILMADDGIIKPVIIGGINIKGLRQEHVFGTAAQIRKRVEESVTDEQRATIWARYGDSKSIKSKKYDGMELLATGHRLQLRRSDEMLQDCIWHIVCTDIEREACPMYLIAKKHGLSAGTVHSTIVNLRKILRRYQDGADSTLRQVFKKDNVL